MITYLYFLLMIQCNVAVNCCCCCYNGKLLFLHAVCIICGSCCLAHRYYSNIYVCLASLFTTELFVSFEVSSCYLISVMQLWRERIVVILLFLLCRFVQTLSVLARSLQGQGCVERGFSQIQSHLEQWQYTHACMQAVHLHRCTSTYYMHTSSLSLP